MLSVANVRSPSAAASYFAADNYYTGADADRSGTWVGKGAERLGLEGRVSTEQFDALLRGELPGGIQVGNAGQAHRPGTDLTFSLPKSWSLLALVGGDQRIIDAYREAVIETLRWAEKNAAQTRMGSQAGYGKVATDNLTIGLFQHDTNRNQEPNLHFHAVVANVTQGSDGKWRALRNDKLWSFNTLLNSMTMARFRLAVEKMGYEAGPVGKHGNFEAGGIAREQVMAFSTRREEVLAARRGSGLEAGIVATLETRKGKEPVRDREGLLSSWRQRAEEVGLDLGGLIDASQMRAAARVAGGSKEQSLLQRGIAKLREFAQRIKGDPADPLIPAHVLKQDAPTIAAAQAVASAVRHLSQREAAFPREGLLKAALDFGLPTTVDHIETRVNALVRGGALEPGKGEHRGWLASREALDLESTILANVDQGRGAVLPILDRKDAAERVQAVAAINHGILLNEGQEDAAGLVLSSRDRIVAIQGVAGAGKSSVMKPVAQLVREEGKQVLGLAVQNTLVQMLERDTGIRSMTIARFLAQWGRLLHEPGNATLLGEARSALGDHVLVLDEASMVSNDDKAKLVRLANLAEVHRLVLVGDKRQLGAVDAGKPFDLVQQAGIERANMDVNLRGRDPILRRAQAAAQEGRIDDALQALAPSTIKARGDSAIVAAEKWLSLSPADRDRTSIYASGRALRSAVNEAVQRGLKANGELGPRSGRLTVHSRVNVTHEELRYLRTYQPGMVLNFRSRDSTQKLSKGDYTVKTIDHARKQLVLEDRKGRVHKFNPARLRPGAVESRLSLFERKSLSIIEGDKIRWTDNDHKRGLFNADQARIVAIDTKGVLVKTSAGKELRLSRGDPMLKRLNLAYALNAHMAQGLTSDRGIAVMDSRERNLANRQTFLVTVTRLRDGLTLIADNAEKLGRAIKSNSGEKASALEVTQRLKAAAANGLSQDKDVGSALPASDKPELTKEKVKPFEIGI
ncbi:IncW plasmid conjugative relaxase protein TrwC [Altererythrobacter epoxidivorans]|uniref:IncW plasmid conjugative relaxase protein TrwC n=1 Tax=Altererythrobacter epoxidivorans TaxID=361183 RepID=A0A0M4MED4_9SPHN|nr:MobF family relaxase [Altererythrobacter epoxidivorans]ALE15368.1 IncW plasmid conjugative relaxase protein TrwC [Altererythrobacter epoxidivorans]